MVGGRFYRDWGGGNQKNFQVTYRETDLWISTSCGQPQPCLELVKSLRSTLDQYIEQNPAFKESMEPVAVSSDAPEPVQEMARYAARVGVGPLAAVAGLFSERVGRMLAEEAEEVIVENGGDIFAFAQTEKVVGLYAGRHSPFTGRLGLKIAPEDTPIGICTSAGTVGPSVSRGNADAVLVMSPSTVLADAAATAAGNMIRNEDDLSLAVKWAEKQEGITGFLAVKNQRIAFWGKVQPVRINCNQ